MNHGACFELFGRRVSKNVTEREYVPLIIKQPLQTDGWISLLEYATAKQIIGPSHHTTPHVRDQPKLWMEFEATISKIFTCIQIEGSIPDYVSYELKPLSLPS